MTPDILDDEDDDRYCPQCQSELNDDEEGPLCDVCSAVLGDVQDVADDMDPAIPDPDLDGDMDDQEEFNDRN